MAKKIISRALLIVFVLALAAVPVFTIFMPSNKGNQKLALKHDTQLLVRLQQIELTITSTPSPTPMPTSIVAMPLPTIAIKATPKAVATVNVVQSTITPKPIYIASIIQDKEISNWTMYKSGSMVDASFSFAYPSSWNVTYKKDPSDADAYQFLFSQASGSQVMTIQLYAPATSANAFIATHYPNKLSSETFGTIGKETLYRLSPSENLSSTDPVNTVFGSRGLVLGKQHAYTISFDTNPDHSMITLIEQIIWSKTTFK